jgi:hypothetical protein
MTILEDLFPHIAMPFLDDIRVKGPYTDYDNKESLPGIRRFVYEHIQNLDKTMECLERAGACIGAKSQFCQDGMNVVGFICGYNGRSPASSKVIKILEWPPCKNITEAKSFIGICVYYRIWVKDFVIIAEPVYRLFKKGVKWDWGNEQEKAIETLKLALTTAPALVKIHYGPDYGDIIVGVDASLEGWGCTMGQLDAEGQRRVARYESGLWNKAERGYDATKRECRGVLKAFRRLRYWLYGVHFILETDAKVLVAQLNRAAIDLPGALVTRWIAWIRLFDFEVKHVKGSTHTAADGLSRRPRTESDDLDDLYEEDIDDWIATELNYLRICPIGVEFGTEVERLESRDLAANQDNVLDRVYSVNRLGHMTRPDLQHQNTPELNYEHGTAIPRRTIGVGRVGTTIGSKRQDNSNAAFESRDLAANQDNVLDRVYSRLGHVTGSQTNPLFDYYHDESQRIARWLTTLKRPMDMSRQEYRTFKNKATRFSVRDQQLWRNATKAFPPRLVIDSDKQRADIMFKLHDEIGHKGRESTYSRIASRYYWDNCWKDVKTYVSRCKECQHRAKYRAEEALFPTKASGLFRKICIDVVSMPQSEGKSKLVVARDDLSGWVEAKAYGKVTAKIIAQFIWDEIICRHGLFDRLVVDGGGEFKGEVIRILNTYDIKRIQVSAYHAQANGMIEGGHKAIVAALITLTDGGTLKWTRKLSAVLFAERTTIHGPTGHTPFYLVYGREAVLPVETQYPTWRTIGWNDVHTREELLLARTRQIEMRAKDIEESMYRKTRRRQMGQEYFDSTHNIRKEPLQTGDLILRHDTFKIEVSKSSDTKLNWRWLGPYRISKMDALKGTYWLEELDGTGLAGTYAGNRIKKFVERGHYFYSAYDKEQGVEEGSDDESEENLTDSVNRERDIANEFTQRVQNNSHKTMPTIEIPELSKTQQRKYVRFEEDWGSE